MNKNVAIISQLILQSKKTDRQVSFNSVINLNRSASTSGTPLSVGLGPHIYYLKGSSTFIDTLSELNLSISNDEICQIKKNIIKISTD